MSFSKKPRQRANKSGADGILTVFAEIGIALARSNNVIGGQP
jgi:hypothetical protein